MKRNILKVVLVLASFMLVFMLAGCTASAPKTPTPVVASIGDRITALETQHANTDGNAAKLETRVSNIEKDLKSIPDTKEVNDAVNKANTAVTSINEAQSKINETQSKAADAQLKANDAQTKVTEAQTKITALEKEIATLKQADSSATWSQTQKDVEALKIQLTALQNKVDTLTKTTTDGTTDSTDLIDNGELSVKIMGGRYLYVYDIGGQYKPEATGVGAYSYIKFKISNESKSDVSVYELKLTLNREDAYSGDPNMTNYEYEIATSSKFNADAFVVDSVSAKKITFYSVVTYDVDAGDYDEIEVWIRIKFTQDNELYDETDNTYPGDLKFTSSISITDYEELED